MNDWHPYPEYENRFEITKCGRVRSLSRVVRSRGGTRVHKGKERKVFLVSGYPAVNCWVNGKQKTLLLHRAIATLFVPNPNQKPFVNHIDGQRNNNDPKNLEWCTHQENMQHAHDYGLIPPSQIGPGEKSPSSKLTDESVHEIKRLLQGGWSCRKIAPLFGVCSGTIDHIRAGRTWSHIR